MCVKCLFGFRPRESWKSADLSVPLAAEGKLKLIGEFSNPLSQNRYTYCHNNPYKYDDPTGHLPASGINKYAANALMDGGGSETSSNTTVKPLPKKTTSNVTTVDYRATNIDEAHAGNQ